MISLRASFPNYKREVFFAANTKAQRYVIILVSSALPIGSLRRHSPLTVWSSPIWRDVAPVESAENDPLAEPPFDVSVSDGVDTPTRRHQSARMVIGDQAREEASVEKFNIVGLDLAKNTIQVHVADGNGAVLLRRKCGATIMESGRRQL